MTVSAGSVADTVAMLLRINGTGSCTVAMALATDQSHGELPDDLVTKSPRRPRGPAILADRQFAAFAEADDATTVHIPPTATDRSVVRVSCLRALIVSRHQDRVERNFTTTHLASSANELAQRCPMSSS